MATTEPPIFGRRDDLSSIERFVEAVWDGSAGLVIAGEAGIGKTTLWHAALRAAQRRGYRVLVARPSESEARLSYSGLGDLLDVVDVDAISALPEPQRRALEVALLKTVDDGNPPDQRSVSVAALGLLRQLSAATPVLVAVDDVQWLDSPSARVLHFVTRRLGVARVGVVVSIAPQAATPSMPSSWLEASEVAISTPSSASRYRSPKT
jgi:predicted ATPase